MICIASWDAVEELGDNCPLCGRACYAHVLAYSEEVEQRIHAMWQTAHIRGEWFGAGSEHDILTRARRAQREQVEAVLDGGSTCSDGGSEGYRRALEVPLLVLSQTGMQRG